MRFPLSLPRPFQRNRFARHEALAGYLLISPQLAGFLLFVLAPLLAVFWFSTQDRSLLSPAVDSVGAANYVELLTNDPLFRTVLLNSLIFAGGLVPLNLALALGLALLLSKPLFGITFFRTLFFAPVVTSAVAWAIVWRFLLQGEQGTVNQTLQIFGIEGPNWLREPGWAMAAVVITRVIKGVGLNMLIFLAALKDLPQDFIDAATVDGANPWDIFRSITLPLIAPTTLMVLVITIIGSLKVFDHIMLMTEGGPANATLVLVYYIYYQAFRNFELGYASSLAVILFAVTLALTLLQWALRKRFVYNEQ